VTPGTRVFRLLRIRFHLRVSPESLATPGLQPESRGTPCSRNHPELRVTEITPNLQQRVPEVTRNSVFPVSPLVSTGTRSSRWLRTPEFWATTGTRGDSGDLPGPPVSLRYLELRVPSFSITCMTYTYCLMYFTRLLMMNKETVRNL